MACCRKSREWTVISDVRLRVLHSHYLLGPDSYPDPFLIPVLIWELRVVIVKEYRQTI